MFKTLLLFLPALVFVASASIEILNPDHKIVGGYPVTIDEFPYQASIEKNEKHHCGGSILNRWWILSAAHCYVDETLEIYAVRVGATFAQSGGRVYSIQGITSHPNYNSVTYDYDIALIAVAEPIEFTNKIQIVPLPQVGEIIGGGKTGWISGWGARREGGANSQQLYAVQVPTLENEDCIKMIETLTSRMLCAGFLEGGKDSCQGDSGGPYVIDDIQQGIISSGPGCARPNSPGLYTRVGLLREWINEIAGI